MDLIGVIIFILFVVARALGESQKKKKQFEEKQRRSFNKPDIPKFDPREIRRMPVDDTTKKVFEDDRPLAKAENLKKEIEEEISERFRQKQRTKTKQVDKRLRKKDYHPAAFVKSPEKQIEPRTQTLDYQKPNASPSLVFNENQIVQGIIMSEILQPPKARRR